MSSQERDERLLSVGAQCQHPTCHLVDFLPFKCQHCSQRYCGEHFKPTAHECDKYDESKVNRIAPACPLCNTPVAIPPGQDPNIRMERHINTQCSVMTGKSKAKSSPVCARAKCDKILFAPISCEKCNQQFCPSHRFPSTHNCSAVATSSKPQPHGTTQSFKTLEDLSHKTSAASSAAMAAIKRSMASQSTPALNQSRSLPPPVKTSTSDSNAKPKSSHNNPFSQVDRRAKAERESRRKAMQERARKGLLTEEEKLILATEEAEQAMRAESKDGECNVM